MKPFNTTSIAFIQDRACERVGEIFDAMNIEYIERHDYLQAACPVHDGNNQRGMFWAIRSNHWQCKTRGCHTNEITGPSTSIFGLVRGAMTTKTNRNWNFQEAVHFVAQVLGLEQCYLDNASAQDIEISKIVKRHRKKQLSAVNKGVLLATMLNHMKADQVYYPNRGVSPEIIAKYHISFCNTKGKEMYKRSFFPILDITGRYISGWSGRSIYEQCSRCKMYHYRDRQECPSNQHRGIYTKWRHSKDFHTELCLYNIWYAKPFISRTGTVILCEGPGDVWAYETAGIKNSVAVFGVNISRQQRLMLQNAGALTIILSFDNDVAGQNAMQKIEKELTNYFRIFCITPDTVNDIADMLPEDIAEKIGPILRKTSREKMFANDHVGEN